jgi:hypothetical protein
VWGLVREYGVGIVSPCSSERARHFGGTYIKLPGLLPLPRSSDFLLGLLFKCEDRRNVPRRHPVISKPRGVIVQKTVLSVAAVNQPGRTLCTGCERGGNS